MRINRVTMEGFGTFKEQTEVDFAELGADGLFLITGRTGTGKSTLLDAISYALYDVIPSAESKGSDKVRSHYCGPADKTEVSVEFTVGESTYKVTRSPEYDRPKARGAGTTKERARAAFSRLTDAGWQDLEATQVRKVAELINDTVGLNAAQFRQVILLAQGQFQEFLLADTKTRADLLRNLFDSSRFDRHAAEFKARHAALATTMEAHRTRVATVAEAMYATAARLWPEALPAEEDGSPETEAPLLPVPTLTADLIDWATGLVQRHREVASLADTAATAAAESEARALRAFTRAQQAEALRQRRETARARLTELEAEHELYDGFRHQLERSNQSAPIVFAHRQQLAAETAANASRLRLDQVIQEARSVVESAGLVEAHVVDREHGELSLVVDDLKAQAARLESAVDREQSATALRSTLARLDSELLTTQERHDEAVDRATELNLEAASLAADQTEADALAATLPEALASVESLQSALTAGANYISLAEEVSRLEVAHREAAKLALEATEVHTELLQRRVEHLAGSLARDLVPGDPCQVCGGTEHPRPARSSHAVADSEIERADRDRAGFVTKLETASAVLSNRQGALESMNPASEESLETLKAELIDQETLVRDITAALDRAASVAAKRQHLTDSATTWSAKASDAALAIAAATASIAAAADQLRAAESEVDAARGDFDTVALRVEAVNITTAALDRVLAAQASLISAIVQAENANAALTEVLAASAFDSADSAQASLLGDEAARSLEQRLRAFDAEVTSCRTTLAAPEFVDLSETPIDLAPLELAFLDAQDRHARTRETAGSAGGYLTAALDALRSLTTLVTASAEQQAEFDLIRQLAEAVNGGGSNTRKMKLETFVLAAELEKVLAAANSRLSAMTSGRYELCHSDSAGRGSSGLDVVVRDAHSGLTRSPASLSGGEKFQASLSLALGLADVVTAEAGGIRLDTLFIDEGFGSLDAETLDLTMATLDGLRTGGRTLGLISHVESMKERIGTQLRVERTAGGWSRIAK